MENIKKTIAQEAKELLSAVPADDFLVYRFSDNKGKCCVIGHWTRLRSSDPSNYDSDNCHDEYRSPLRSISTKFLEEVHNIVGSNIATVNNGDDVNGYNEPEVKDRVLHLLDDMIAAGY